MKAAFIVFFPLRSMHYGRKGPLCRSIEAPSDDQVPYSSEARGKIRDWYLSRAAPTSVRPMERAADNSKPAAPDCLQRNKRKLACRHGAHDQQIGAAPECRCCVSRAEPDQNWGRKKPVLMAIHMKAHRIQPVVGYDIAQRSNENTPSWKASTDSLGAPVPDCETTIQVTSYVSLSLSRATGSLTTDIRLGRCGK